MKSSPHRLTLLGVLALLLAVAPGARAAEPYVMHADVSYDLGSPAPLPTLNQLDLYVPHGLSSRSRRPLVVYVHGGGWLAGDKSRVGHKAKLFTRAGYLFASVNYRLSPPLGGLPAADRVRFPDHPHDVGEALGWLTRNVRGYGGNPRRLVLIGHSAGAHLAALVGADPSFGGAYGVRARAVRGVVSLDTAAFDVTGNADPAADHPLLFWNAFGLPGEEAADPQWASASPVEHADRHDPPFLLVTQRRRSRIAENAAMLRALGDRRRDSLVTLALDHAGINEMLGSPSDTTRETTAVMRFVRDVAPR